MIFQIDFGTVPTGCYFLFLILLYDLPTSNVAGDTILIFFKRN